MHKKPESVQRKGKKGKKENVKGMANKFDEIITNFKEYLGEEYIYDYRLLKANNSRRPSSMIGKFKTQ